jgi:hypothetical protein
VTILILDLNDFGFKLEVKENRAEFLRPALWNMDVLSCAHQPTLGGLVAASNSLQSTLYLDKNIFSISLHFY